jgi:hypothetical protein
MGMYVFPTRTKMVNSPGFHSVWDPQQRPWKQAHCTPESIMVHYMTERHWDTIQPDGVLLC